MTVKHAKCLVLLFLAGLAMMPAGSVRADESTGTKPPIVVTQGNTRYIFTTQDDQFRKVLLNSKNLEIHTRESHPSVGNYPKDYWYQNPYIDNKQAAANAAGAAVGYLLSK